MYQLVSTGSAQGLSYGGSENSNKIIAAWNLLTSLTTYCYARNVSCNFELVMLFTLRGQPQIYLHNIMHQIPCCLAEFEPGFSQSLAVLLLGSALPLSKHKTRVF